MSKSRLSKPSRSLGLAVLFSLASNACDHDAARAAPENSKVAPDAEVERKVEKPVIPAEKSLAQPSYDEDAFVLSLAGPSQVKVGQPVQLVVTLTAKNGFKVNDEYPVKFRLNPTQGLTLTKDTVGKEDGQLEKTKIQIPVELKADQAGSYQVTGKFSFSVCTDDRCLIEKRDLSAALTAS